MSKNRHGFTIIEVVIFLAITSIIFMAIILGTRNVMSRQRYNESTQNFAEFLRGVYSKLTSIENHGDGRSDRVIYGKLVTFGEKINFSGENNDGQEIFVYDIIGDVDGSINGEEVLQSLVRLNSDVIKVVNEDVDYAGIRESYSPRWMAKIEKTNSHDYFKGAVIVVRSAASGAVYTYTMSGETLEVNQAVHSDAPKKLFTSSNLSGFSNSAIDFCIGSDDGNIYNGLRRNVRIVANARNSSGVEVMPLDDPSQNACQKL